MEPPFSKGGIGRDFSGRLLASTKAPPGLFKEQTRAYELFLAASAAAMSPAAKAAATKPAAAKAAATKPAAAKVMH